MRKYKHLNSILLIDDDEATNFLNEATIEDMNLDLRIYTVYNAQDGLDFLNKTGKFDDRTSNTDPGIIFLDINMPGMSGWDFLEEYDKLEEEKKAKVTIAMLTTSLNPDDKAKAESMGAIKEFMYKPLTEEQVNELIEDNFERIA